MSEEIARREKEYRIRPERFYISNDPKILEYSNKIED
jgi:hypothetical protein